MKRGAHHRVPLFSLSHFFFDNAAKLQSPQQISKFSTKNFTFQTIEYIF